jgi:dTDP-glucose pyrophosphorylase
MSGIDIRKFIATKSFSVVNAMEKIDNNSSGLIFIIDKEERLIGSLTDGDIRRWLISTGNLNAKVDQVMHANVRFLFENERGKAEELMRRETIHVLPIVDRQLRIVDIVTDKRNSNEIEPRSVDCLKDIPIIVMAGGKGTRLYPYTKILPKPLIPIGDIPILERIFDRFYLFGSRKFYVTVNYKKDMIKAYFNDLKPSYEIEFIDEDKPLGTAGSIRLINERFSSPVVVTNCDILIEVDYEKLLQYHKDSGNDITVVSSLKKITVPYGVLTVGKEGKVTDMEEKPQFSYFINTGMYIVNPEYLELIPLDKVFHMTDLVELMMTKGKHVGTYPISENSFLDMGQFEEMERMEEIIRGKNSEANC